MKKVDLFLNGQFARAAIAFMLFLALVTGPALPAKALVLHDNLGIDDSFVPDEGWGVGCVLFFGGCIFRLERAMPFVPPEGDSFVLESITLALDWMYGPDYTVNLNIAADNAGQPGPVIETAEATAPVDPGTVTVNFSGTTMLEGGETYWLWLSKPGSAKTLVNWLKNASGITGTVGQSTNRGASWVVDDFSAEGEPNVPSAFRVTGSVLAPVTQVLDLDSNDQDVILYGKAENDSLVGDGHLLSGNLNNDAYKDLIVAAPHATGPGDRASAGAVYIYKGTAAPEPVWDAAGTFGREPEVVIYGASASDFLGYSRSVAVGDVNGDSIDDLIVGAPLADATAGKTRPGSGAVYVFYGAGNFSSRGTIDLATDLADVTIIGAAAGDALGSGGILAGDIAGSSIADIIIGAPKASPSARANAGAAYIIAGSNTLAATYDLAIGQYYSAIHGASVGDELTADRAMALGDFNQSGRLDLAVGSSAANSNAGRAYIVFGANSLPATVDLAAGSADVVISGASAGDALTAGGAISAGDVNGSGGDDLLLGAPGAASQAGAAYLIYGKSSLPAAVDLSAGDQDVTFLGASASDRLTADGALALRDITGNGFADIILGAPGASFPSRAQAGAAYIVFGSSTLDADYGLATDYDVTITGGSAGDALTAGGAISTGDITGDGINDLVLGASAADGPNNSRTNAGEAYILHGKEAGAWNRVYNTGFGAQDFVIYGADAGDSLASQGAIATLDLTRSGVEDLSIAAPFADGYGEGRTDSGEVYLFLGSEPPLSATVKKFDFAGNPLPKDYNTARATIDYASGSNTSQTTVVLTRSKDGVGQNPASRVGNVYWEIATDRTSYSASITFHYTAADIAGLRENTLGIRAAAGLGAHPYTSLATTHDINKKTLTVSGITNFSTNRYFIIFGNPGDGGSWESASALDDLEIAGLEEEEEEEEEPIPLIPACFVKSLFR